MKLGDKLAVKRGELTPKQRACYEMRKSGSTWVEIGHSMGMAAQTVRDHVEGAVRNGMVPLPKERYARRVDVNDPEAVKRMIAKQAIFAPPKDGAQPEFNLDKFIELAQAAGVPPRMAGALGRRVQLNFGPVREEIKRLTLAQRVEATFAAADLALSYIDEMSIAGMNAKDLAFTYGVLIDKALVMGGRPNVIVDFNSRRRLEALMPEFLAEAKRRGITIDGTATVVQERVLQVEG